MSFHATRVYARMTVRLPVMKAYMRSGGIAMNILTSALQRGECLALRPGRLFLLKRTRIL
jgi:hypothetical protein